MLASLSRPLNYNLSGWFNATCNAPFTFTLSCAPSLFPCQDFAHAPHRLRQVFQHHQGLWLHQAGGRLEGRLRPHHRCAGRGIPELTEGMKLSYELQDDKRGRGQQAAELQLL
jgi:hypothetical protein